MGEKPTGFVTQVLKAAGEGDSAAAAELLPLVYDELRKLARARMADVPPGNTLQPTALVHEVYVRLIGDADPSWNSRGHFFGAAAEAMRQILVEQVRRKGRLKHGGGRKRVGFDDAEPLVEPPADDVLALDGALARLEQDDPRKAKIVKLRYFAGLSTAETAAALDISEATVRREVRFSRALLSMLIDDQETAI